MAANFSRDSNRFTSSADWMLGVVAGSSMAVFIGEVLNSVLMLIDGCVICVSVIDDLISGISSDGRCCSRLGFKWQCH